MEPSDEIDPADRYMSGTLLVIGVLGACLCLSMLGTAWGVAALIVLVPVTIRTFQRIAAEPPARRTAGQHAWAFLGSVGIALLTFLVYAGVWCVTLFVAAYFIVPPPVDPENDFTLGDFGYFLTCLVIATGVGIVSALATLVWLWRWGFPKPASGAASLPRESAAAVGEPGAP